MKFCEILAGLPKPLAAPVIIVSPEQEARARELDPAADIRVAEDLLPGNWFMASPDKPEGE